MPIDFRDNMARESTRLLFINPMDQMSFDLFTESIHHAASTVAAREIIGKVVRKYGCGVIDSCTRCLWTDDFIRVILRARPGEAEGRLDVLIQRTPLADPFLISYHVGIMDAVFRNKRFHIPPGVETSVSPIEHLG